MSTISRRAFGKLLRDVRVEAAKSALAAGLEIETSKQTLLRLEDGVPTKIATPQLEKLLDFYEAAPTVREEVLSRWSEIREEDKTAKAQGNSKGFWRAYSDQVAPNFPKFLRLEGAASEIIAHQTVIVPGLLQTPDYRRAIMRISEPELSLVDLERRIELNEHRQARLHETDFHLEAFLSEAVLRNRAGDLAVMSAQLRWLAEASGRQNIDIHVIPFSSGPHLGLIMQTFTLLRFPTGVSGMTLPPFVYAEGAIGSVFHEQDDEVGLYERAIEAMRAVALTEEGTRDLVLRVAEEYAT